YVNLLHLSGVTDDTIFQTLCTISFEIWKKRRTGLTYLVDYIETNLIDIELLLGESPDIQIVNVLAQVAKQGGGKMFSKMKVLKTHSCIVCSQLSKIKDDANSPLFKSFVKEYQFNYEAKPKYETVWEISALFYFINNWNTQSNDDVQVKAMALLVAFSAARMIELARMVLEDICYIGEQMQIQVLPKKCGILWNDTIKLNPRHCKCCPIEGLQIWILIRQSISSESTSLRWNFTKRTDATSQNCSKLMSILLRMADIPSTYSGPSIRHSMMTRLKQSGLLKLRSIHLLGTHLICKQSISTIIVPFKGILYLYCQKRVPQPFAAKLQPSMRRPDQTHSTFSAMKPKMKLGRSEVAGRTCIIFVDSGQYDKTNELFSTEV
ncbi:MAG: hypothetical protein EZS28_034637, partial [Streblomastix strix]